jgi:Cu(I)/Ag(I) efflux system membrane fusion protein
LKGLSEGQSVVLSGQFLIDSEASLRSAITRLSSSAADVGAASQAAPAHLTQGTIEAIDANTVTLAHEPVPSLNWPAMTMAFAKPDAGLPDELRVGDRVRFSFIQSDGGGYQIATIDKRSGTTR